MSNSGRWEQIIYLYNRRIRPYSTFVTHSELLNDEDPQCVLLYRPTL